MATPDVQHHLNLPAGAVHNKAIGRLRLIAVDDLSSAHGYVTATGAAIGGTWTARAVNGIITYTDVVANVNITPSNTVYEVVTSYLNDSGKRTMQVEYITVPDETGPVNVVDCLTDPPAALTSSALALTQVQVSGKVDRAGDTLTGALGSSVAGGTGRWVGKTTAVGPPTSPVDGAPTSGTYAVGDWLHDSQGERWECVTAGTPGSWVKTSGRGRERHGLAESRPTAVAFAKAGGSAPTPTNIVLGGDSITEGYYGNASGDDGMIDTRIRQAIARHFNAEGRWGKHIPAGGNWYRTERFSANAGSSVTTNSGIALRGRQMYNGDTAASATILCDRITVNYRLMNVFATGHIGIAVDGVEVADIATYATDAPYCNSANGERSAQWDSGALTRGYHKLEVYQKSSGGFTGAIKWDSAYFYDGDYSGKKVRVYNASHFGYSFASYVNLDNTTSNAGPFSSIRANVFRPDQWIWIMGVNDQDDLGIDAIDAVQLEADMRGAISRLWAAQDVAGQTHCEQVLVVPWNWSISDAAWNPGRDVYYRVAGDLGLRVWDYCELIGSVSAGDPYGLVGSGAHPNEYGMRVIGDWLASKILEGANPGQPARILHDRIDARPQKSPCRLATTANITLSGEQTIDGVSAVIGDRVLVKDQSTGANNGIYLVAYSTWQRAEDCDTTGDIITGTTALVTAGTANGGKTFRCTTTGTITLGTTATVWSSLYDPAGTTQPLDSDLTAIAALSSAANKVPYATGSGTWSLADFTAAGRALVDDADASAQLTTLGLGAGGLRPMVSASKFTTTTVSGTTNETDLLNLATPAVTAGDILIVKAAGTLTNGAGAANLTFRLRIGGTEAFVSAAQATGLNVNSRIWRAEFTICCPTTGTQRTDGDLQVSGLDGATFSLVSTALTMYGYGETSVDLSSASTVRLTVTHSSSSGSVSSLCKTASVMRIAAT